MRELPGVACRFDSTFGTCRAHLASRSKVAHAAQFANCGSLAVHKFGFRDGRRLG
jgi:hypothetical protein